MSNPKELRKQLRNVIQDMTPEIIKTELFEAIRKDTKEHLERLSKEVRDALARIDSNAKDTQNYVMRQVNAALIQKPVVTTTVKEDDSK